MSVRHRLLAGAALLAASPFLATAPARAMSGPAAIDIDGGPLGPLEVSGGLDGYGYVLSGTGDRAMPNPALGDRGVGMNLANGLVELQKASGVLQFTVEAGAYGTPVALGTKPLQTSTATFSTGPLYLGYLTIAPPDSPFTVSAGQLSSLEGYEGAIDWNNANPLVTELWSVENTQYRGAQVAFARGPVAATVSVGDGYDTGVFNVLQALVTYTPDKNDAFDVYYGGNLGRTGLNAHTYGSSVLAYDATSLAEAGPWFDNSQLFGAYASFVRGNLTLVPEIQFQYAKADARLGMAKYSSNLGAALFADYAFGASPWSIGAWAEYWTSNGPDSWFIGAGSAGEAISLTPTWQYKNLFARADAGVLYLNRTSGEGGARFGYGADATGHVQFTGLLEAGVLF